MQRTMATTDVRKLLQQSKQKRQISHPYAKYTSLGALVCTICDSKFSSDALWTPHVQSASHRENAMQNKLAQQHKAKRMLDLESGTTQDEQSDIRINDDQPSAKRLRAEERKEEGHNDEKQEELNEQQDLRLPSGFFDKTQQQQEATPTAESATVAVNEEEWAAFQADIAQSTREKDQQQAEEDEETARDVVAEEFDEVERLQQRVSALKSKREALRQSNGNSKASTKTVVPMNEDEDDEDEDSDADDLAWHKL